MNFLRSIFNFSQATSPSPIIEPFVLSIKVEEPIGNGIKDIIQRIKQRDPNVVVIRDVGDGFLWSRNGMNVDRAIFPQADTLILDSWNKNGVYYNLDKITFPSLKNIVLLCHPCEYSVPKRFIGANWYIQYSHRYFEG